MNKKERNHIMNMNRGMKQKISMLLIACLLFTGYQGMTLPGRAAQEDEQNNAISVSGTEVKVQLLGEDLRRAAKEAIEKGERVNDKVFKGYSKDADLEKEYEAVFSPEKEVYEISLDSISAGLSESLAEEEAGLEVFVERDAQDLDNLVRKESKESLLLYDGNSQISQLFPKSEETAVKKEEAEKKASEELASNSNLPRNTELTGSELITFLYKNKSDHRITFQLSVDSNKYPKVVVSPKGQLFKELLAKLKKEEKNRTLESKKNTENKAVESTEVKNTAAKEPEESKAATETVATEAQKESTSVKESTSAAQESSSAAASEVRLVSEESKQETKVETAAAETEEKAQTAAESKETAASETEKETAGQKETEKRAEEKLGNGFLAEVVAHYDEFLAEFQSARFTQYSLNELGRKSQNAEIENFATVEVFYDKDAFDEDVVLEAKRLVKPEEEGQKEGEKLTEEQIKVLKEHNIYDDAESLDIRFISKADREKEVEPKAPVSVRITIEKAALPEEASPDVVAIHHLVENEETKRIERVETVVQASYSKNDGLTSDDSEEVGEQAENSINSSKETDALDDDNRGKETITKEFTVNSFSLYQITWKADAPGGLCDAVAPIRFHYVDKNFNEIGPTERIDISAKGAKWHRDGNWGFYDSNNRWFYYEGREKWRWYIEHNELGSDVYYDSSTKTGKAMKSFDGYHFLEVYPYNPDRDNMDEYVHGQQEDYFTINWSYGPGNTDFREGIKRIDDTGFTLPITLPGSNTPRYTWFAKDRGEDSIRTCRTHDFYFVYDTEPKDADKRPNEDTEDRHEKYITDNKDGTYDLTLTGQVKRKSQEKLDIIFLLDSTKSMNLPFTKDFEKYKASDYAQSGNSKMDVTKRYIADLVDNLSKNSSYDLRYALVGFGGERTEKPPRDQGSIVYAGNDPAKYITKVADGKTMTVSDTAWNDTTHVYGFTSSAATFRNNLNNIPQSHSDGTGANYVAAIAGLKYLLKNDSSFLNSGSITNASGSISNNGGRSDAKKIVVMLSSTDPMYSYIMKDGVYDDTFLDDTLITDVKPSRSAGIEFHSNFSRGSSYGNGQYFSRVALNQARGYLSEISNYAAFYSVGIGNANNWKHLKELTEAHAYDQSDKWAKFGTKFIRAKSVLAKGADSKVLDGSTPAQLEQSLNELRNIIEPTASELTIYDKLSENVTLVPNTELKAEVFKMKANEVEPDGAALSDTELKKMGLNQFILTKDTDADGKDTITLKTDPSSFNLPSGYEIRLTAKIRPSQTAFEKLNNNKANTDEGEIRTDLNSIYTEYLHKTFGDATKYGTSYKKLGLYTNDKAYFGYKYKGKDGVTTEPKKPYNKPIIKVEGNKMGYLKIQKNIQGIPYDQFYDTSSGLTNLGHQVMNQMKFEIWQEKGGVQSLLTTVDLSNAKLHKPGIYKIDGYKIGIDAIENDASKGIVLNITIYDLPLNMSYRILEKDIDKNTVLKEGTVSTQGYQFKEKVPSSTQTEGWKYIPNSTLYELTNIYKPVNLPKSITIKKVVEEFGGTALTQEAKSQVFDFYIALYKYDGTTVTAPSFSDYQRINQNWKDEHPGDSRIGGFVGEYDIPMADGSTLKNYMIRVSLKHGESINLSLDSNMYYKILEKKEKKYEVAKVEVKNLVFPVTETVQKVSVHGSEYTITSAIYNEGKEFTFKNPRITLVPTGLRGDFTPYVLCLCGFTFMAGVYLSIKKKKREEV